MKNFTNGWGIVHSYYYSPPTKYLHSNTHTHTWTDTSITAKSSINKRIKGHTAWHLASRQCVPLPHMHNRKTTLVLVSVSYTTCLGMRLDTRRNLCSLTNETCTMWFMYGELLHRNLLLEADATNWCSSQTLRTKVCKCSWSEVWQRMTEKRKNSLLND